MGYTHKGSRLVFGLGQLTSGTPGARVAQDGEAVLGILRRTVDRFNGPFPNDPVTLNNLKTGMATMGFTATEQERTAKLFASNPNPSNSEIANALNGLVIPDSAPTTPTTVAPTPAPTANTPIPSEILSGPDFGPCTLRDGTPGTTTIAGCIPIIKDDGYIKHSPNQPNSAPALISTQKYLNHAYLVMGGIVIIIALIALLLFR